MKPNATKYLAFIFAFLLLFPGCSRNKELERANKEQARMIADLNQEVARLKEEVGRVKEAQAKSVPPPVQARQGARDLKALVK